MDDGGPLRLCCASPANYPLPATLVVVFQASWGRQLRIAPSGNINVFFQGR